MRAWRKLSWVELKLFLRDPLSVVFTIGFPALVLFVLGQAFGKAPADPKVFRGKLPLDYYVPAYVGLVLAAIGLISLPVHLASYRERGILRRLGASGAPMSAVFGAEVAVAFVMGAVGAVVVLVLGFAVYHVRGPESPLLFLAVFVVGTLCFAAVGFVLGAVMPSARAAQGIGLMLFFVMMFVCGTDGPLEVFGTALQRTSDVLPLKHLVRMLQDAWYGDGVPILSTVVIVAVGVAAGLLSLRVGRHGGSKRSSRRHAALGRPARG